MKTVKRGLLVVLAALIGVGNLAAQKIEGTIVDKDSRETLIGAFIEVESTGLKALSDLDGHFLIEGAEPGRYSLNISYIGYLEKKVDGVVVPGEPLTIELEVDSQVLTSGTVVAEQRRNTQAALVKITRESPVIISNISAHEISRTQDSNAGEVIRRVPGVSLIDDKFVMVRGLSQRYNNVWINGGAAPSSEADARAFSFDLIPSSQIDNLTIVKVPSAEYPADYSGGFIIIGTTDVPEKNSFNVSLGGNFNDRSYKDFISTNARHGSLPGGMDAALAGWGGGMVDLLSNSLDNDWTVRKFNPVSDIKLSSSLSRRWNMPSGGRMGLNAAVNFSKEYRAYTGMQNNLFGAYDYQNGKSVYLRNSTDDQYNDNSRLGAMLNLTYLSADGNNKIQFKNIFNRIDNNRYTYREGVSAQADLEKSAEYFYRSRTTVNTQLTGSSFFPSNSLDWCLGYSYADRMVPDRRRCLVNDQSEPGVYAWNGSNDVSREWTTLHEHIASLSVNDKQEFDLFSATANLKAGIYGEYRTRRYATREFIYHWNANNNTLPAGFKYMDIQELLSDESYMGEDRIHLLEKTDMRNNYRGNNLLGAAYLSTSIPLGRLSILAGLRFEHNDMELISNTSRLVESPMSHHYISDDLFPSVSATYRFNDRHNLRLSYGRTVNRAEFREVSSSVYYDFNLVSDVKGTPSLRSCYIDNVDLRYEFYPSREETVSVAAFYKHFDSPIEWTYTVQGGTDLTYSYINALSADNYGLELDLRKNLSFIGLPCLSVSLNGALINSHVRFEPGSKEEDRPMQGQSPYLINGGIFYNNEDIALDIALLYNRIGKRIIGVGRSEGTSGGEDVVKVPDSYEMPRNSLDLTVSKKFGRHLDVKLYAKNLLGEMVYYKQFEGDIEQVTRAYDPGRNIGIQLVYTL